MKECPICHTCYDDRLDVCAFDRSLLLDLMPGLPVVDNKYKLDKKIGIGRVGMVFKAIEIDTGDTVAVKLISPNLIEADPSLPERFLSLVRAFASLEHPNIVRILDFGQAPNQLYLVMEFLDGKTLATLLQEYKQLPLDMALDIISRVCEAVANANRNGVYHLDLKPSNVFVNIENGQNIVKVVDFGIVRLKAPSLMSKLSPMQRDYVLGKPYYCAPEQFNSEQVDPRSEVYAIGAVLYHLLTGNPPFTGGSYPMLKMQHMGVTPSPLRESRPEIPPTLESVVVKSLEKRSTQRHSSVIALAVQLSAQLAKYKEMIPNQQNNTIPALPSPPEPFYSSDPTPPPISQYTAKAQLDNTMPALPSPPEPFYSSDPTPPPPLLEIPRTGSFNAEKIDKRNGTIPSLPILPEPFYSNDPTPPPLDKPKRGVFKLDETLTALPSPPEPFYSDDPTPLPLSSSDFITKDTLASLPVMPEPFYSNDPTPPPISEESRSLRVKIEKTRGAYKKASESILNTPKKTVATEKTAPNTVKIEESLVDSLEPAAYLEDVTPNPDTDTVYSYLGDKDSRSYVKPSGVTEPVYSIPGLMASTLLLAEGNIVTRPLTSEAFYVGQEFEEPPPSNAGTSEQVQIFEQADIDQVFEQAGIGETAEKASVSQFLEFSTSEQALFAKDTPELSPSCVIYLFVERFTSPLLSGQRGRYMHNNFATERERLAALLLVSSLFSLSCRGVIEISTGNAAGKKQIALSQRNEGFIVRAANLDLPLQDALETKIVEAVKLNKSIRFYNIFLYIAQTSVATSLKEAICEIVTDIIAEELVKLKFLSSKQKTRKLEIGESGIEYLLACDLAFYENQADAVKSWLQALQQQASIDVAGKPVQPFMHILKYYTDLFRHNSKELSK